MREREMSGDRVKRHLGLVIEALDGGRWPRGPRVPRWVRSLALPTAVGLSLGLSGCLAHNEVGEEVTKEEAAAATLAGSTGDLCARLEAEPGCDLCAELGFYDDGACDEFCVEADLVDCAVPEYGVPFEDCDNGADDDGDGAIDCGDSDCFDEPICEATMRYMAIFEVCDDEVDNEGDGLVDCDDPDCAEDPACAATPRYMAPFEG